MKKEMLVVAAVSTTIFTVTQAADIGHYNGGILDIRDFLVPAPGLYPALYTGYYTTDRLNDRNGNKSSSVTINSSSGPVTLNLDVRLNTYALCPAVIWVSPCKILGANYGAYIAPGLANDSLSANFSDAEGRGGAIRSSSFGMGDLLVQPLWLGWTKEHWDFAAGYGFYAPVGKYNTVIGTLPNGATIKVQSPVNIGLGFWTQRAQGAAAWYPTTNKATAVVTALTYEYNGKTEGFELTPGQMLTLNWGVSQYLYLSKSHHFMLEVGPAGYDTWEITDSTGRDAIQPGVHSQVHGVGGQLGLSYTPWNVSLEFHGFYEYAAVARFQGESLGFNLKVRF